MTTLLSKLIATSTIALALATGVAQAKQDHKSSAHGNGSKSTSSKSTGQKSTSKSSGTGNGTSHKPAPHAPKHHTGSKTNKPTQLTTTRVPGTVKHYPMPIGHSAGKSDTKAGPQKDAHGHVSSKAMSSYVSKAASAKKASFHVKGSAKHANAKLLAQKIAFKGWGGYQMGKYGSGGYICPGCGPLVIIINVYTKTIYYPSGWVPSSSYDDCDYVVVGKTYSDCGCDDDQDDDDA